ncbi:MAG: ABC transporter permease [Microbacteriaceae bacterium]|jgi:putative ABC transport system permease protein|nr:ABC transporter permease [Microbacteriaceae bacterium]
MFKTTYRGILQHPVRFLLSVLAVVLGVAFITGVFALRTSLSGTVTQLTDSGYVANVYVRGAKTATPDGTSLSSSLSGHRNVPLSLEDRVSRIRGVTYVAPAMQGTGVLVGKNGTAVAQGGSSTLFLGMDSAEPRQALRVLDGHAPRTDSEIALTAPALKRSGLSIGDHTKVIVGDSVLPVTVVGKVRYASTESGVLMVGISKSLAMSAFNSDGTTSNLMVYGSGGESDAALAKRVATALAVSGSVRGTSGAEASYTASRVSGVSGGVVVSTAAKMRAETNESIQQALGFVSTFLLVFALLALFVGGFIIANTFTQTVRQRIREFAVLRAIGASPAQVFFSVVLQSVIVGFIGSLLGLAGGVGLVAAIRAVLAAMGSELRFQAPVTPQTVLIALITGVLVTVLASLAPARVAAQVPPVAAMQQQSGPERPLTVRGTAGVALLLLGGAAVVIAAIQGNGAGWWLGLGAAAVLLGALLALPLAVRALTTVLGWPFRVLLRPLGAIAQGNVMRNPRRSASTASALMIGMALVGAAAVLAGSTTASVSSIVDQSLRSDFIVQSATYRLPDGFQQQVEQLSDVARTDVLSYSAGSLIQADGVSVQVASVTRGTFAKSLRMPTLHGDLSTYDQGEAVVQKTAAKDHSWKVGDTLRLTSQHGQIERRVRIGAIVDDSSFLGVPVTISTETFDALLPASQSRLANSVLITARAGVPRAELRRQLVSEAKPFYVLSVLDQKQFVSERAQQVQSILNILYALLAMSIVIAVLGIVNTLALSIIERTQEIGLMRAVGLGRLQLAGTIVIESVIIAVLGALAGLGIGVGVASALPSVLSSSGLSTLAIPWGQLLWFVVLSALVGVLAAVIPAVRAARMPVLSAISAE